MNNTKTTKRALLSSVVAMLVCITMLIGTTFAWFTDSVTSAGNKIVAGTLNIDMSVMDENGTYQSVKENSDAIFGYTLWEPGYTEWKNVKVSTTGNLALKYVMNIAIKGERSILADVIDVYYAASEIAKPADRNLDGLTRLGTISEVLDSTTGALISDTLIPDQNNTEDFATIVLKMQESAGNDYQGKTIGEFDIQILATQLTYESDSFDDQYDKDAEYPEIMDKWDGTADTSWYNSTDKTFTLSTAEELAGLSVLSASGNTFSGKTIVLDTGVDLDGKQWTPIKQFSGTFDGGEHTVSNFTLDGTSGRAGFIQNLGQYPATVKNLTLSEVTGIAGSKQYFGILAANGHTSVLENVHVVDCKIETTNKEAWVGGIYGYFNWTSASNCTVENLEIDATDRS